MSTAGPDQSPETSPSAGSGASADPRADRVAAARKAWTRHLVDLGGRNTLLWYRDLPTGTLDLSTAHPAGLARFMAGRETRLSTLVREPTALDDARRRARAIAAKSRELREERGILTGFLALGMASWSLGAGATRVPAAPVLLRPITLRPTGAAQLDYALDLGPDVEVNPVLVHYLASEQGVDLDPDALEELASTSSAFDPFPVYAAISRACGSVPDFAVAPRLVVGNFSYAKLPMVADLAAQGADLANHDVVAALAGDPDAMRSVRAEIPDLGERLDRDPDRDTVVLDADSSQQEAIDAVRDGAHLVIHGPPGTGKSQTIANLIASLAADGKRVLFVAEKRAAIDAVVGRLDRVGLGDLVLDLHDGAQARRRIAQQLSAGLDAATTVRPAPGATAHDTASTVRTTGEILRAHLAAMHEVRTPWGVSAYQAQEAICTLAARPNPPRCRVRLRGDRLAAMGREQAAALGAQLATAAAVGAWSSGSADEDPWFGARIETQEQALAAREVTARLAGGAIDGLQQTFDEVFAGVDVPQARAIRDWGRTLATVANVRDTLETFRPEVFDVPLDELVAATASSAYRRANEIDFGWFERRGLVRQARRLLRPGPPPADLHHALVEASEQRTTWRDMAGAGGRPELPVDLERAQAAYDSVVTDLAWLAGLLGTSEGSVSLLDEDLDTLRSRLAALDARPDRLAVIPTVIGALDSLEEAGLGAVLGDLAARGVPAEDVAAELEFVWWTSVSEDIILRDARIGAHHGDQLRRTVAEFASADSNLLHDNATHVREAVADQVRRMAREDPRQESLIRAEAAKSRRHLALRDLLPVAGRLATTVRPCWVMSPLVVASVLPPGVWFDVVVFDEASQIPPAEAISAISRAHQVVVAGDERQLPPTSFFTTVTEGEDLPADETLTEGTESILDVLAALLPSRRLTWHYRSLDERLIAFANARVYDGSLVTFPGTGTAPVLTHDHVEGSGVLLEGGGAVESTSAEVDRVVALVLDHARTRPEESLGVIALGARHAARIDDALREALTEVTPDVAAFFAEDVPEPFFVKNLERVQGDERDAVLLSIGYGKTPHGRVLHRFGPLNIDGGERRLNVAITRARRRMTVVSSLLAADLDPAKLKARGAQLLREFLAYAANNGRLPGAADEVGDAAAGSTSVVLAELARGLRAHGLSVHEGYGTSADPIDLAVEDPNAPGRLVVAVESDGPEYAAMRTVRDRDRLRAEHLSRLGWRHDRVWSLDVFRDPAHDISRIVALAEGREILPEPDDTGDAEGVDEAVATDRPPRESDGAAAAADPPQGPSAGRVVPEQTRDDTDVGWGELPDESAHDRWLQEQRPPHWE